MERRTELGTFYSRANLPEECYPLNFHFFSEGSERRGKIEDRPVMVLGYVSPCYDSAPGSNMVVLFEDTDRHVASISSGRILYERTGY